MNVSTSVPRWRARATVDVLKQSLVRSTRRLRETVRPDFPVPAS